MGHQLSKQDDDDNNNNNQLLQKQQKQHPLAVNAAKAAASQRALSGHLHQDYDVRSRSTETTVSSTPPASPVMMKFGGDRNHHQQHRSRHCHGRGSHMPLAPWNRPNESAGEHSVGDSPRTSESSIARASNDVASAASTSQDPQCTLPRTTSLTKNDATQRLSVPVKCPSSSSRHRRHTSSSPTGYGDGDDYDYCCPEDASYLERIYDIKSWDMFHRITQARKQRDEQRQQQQAVEEAAVVDVDTGAAAAACSPTMSKASPAQYSSHTQRQQRQHNEITVTVNTGEEMVGSRHQHQHPQHDAAVIGPRLAAAACDVVDDEWENLGLDYDDDHHSTYDENGVETSESHLIFLFDL